MSHQPILCDPGIDWRAEPTSARGGPDPDLLSWLRDTSLLTERIRSACSGFSLQLLTTQDTASSGPNDLYRRVLLRCGGRSWVYAETRIPRSTLTKQPRLLNLGEMPLGEFLKGRPDVVRTPFEYARLEARDLPDDVAPEDRPADGAGLWARRSDFRMGGAGLTVLEVFLCNGRIGRGRLPATAAGVRAE